MNKGELRALYKQIRLRMSAAEVSSKSHMMNKKLINEVDWGKIKKISVFDPITRLNEVNTKPLVSRLIEQRIKVEVMDSSKTGNIPPDKFDLVLVPCLAFDKDNYRLGWGGGFYDKFLAKQPQALKIGVCFQSGFIQAGIPREPHDVPLDRIITEA